MAPERSGTSASTGLAGCFCQVTIPSSLVAMLCARMVRIPAAGVLVVAVYTIVGTPSLTTVQPLKQPPAS